MTQAAAPTRVGTSYPGTGVHPDLLPVGTEVCGFRLLRHVATGSFGSVWQVESTLRPGNLYALKFSLYGPEEHTVADARAEREVQLLRQAAHENVLRVVSTGRWQHPDKGQHYVVLEWVEGGTLWQWAAVTRPHTRQVVRLCQKLARALQRAHEAGVVHRDVKPDNVLVRATDGEPFLADFGVGSARGATPLTLGVAQPGTLSFHSPQLLATHLPGAAPYQAQPADDWYSLGVVLYVLLTEMLPYPEHQPVEVLAQWVTRCKPVPPHQLNPRVPPALGQVALRLLSAEPHQRYPDGQAVVSALEQALATATQPEASLQPAHAPHAALTLPPTTGDGPLARDPEVLGAHVFREEEDPDEERLDRVRALRDTLLRTRTQRRPPRVLRQAASLARQPHARRIAATAVLLAGLLLTAWELGRRSNTPPDMAASAASPQLAPLDASPPKEGYAVKTPPPPTLPSPPAVLPKAADSRTLAALCAAGLATACASVPLRPTQQPCPPEAMAAMLQRDWDTVTLFLDPNTVPETDAVNKDVPLRPGPIISGVEVDAPFTDKGLAGLLYGHVFFAEDGRIVVRYTEVELPGGERVPVCFAVRQHTGGDAFDVQPRSTDGRAGHNTQIAERVRVLPD